MLISMGIYAQTIIENPVHGLSSVPHVELKKIEVTDKQFILHFHTTVAAGSWISIPRHTYIAPAGDTTRTLIVSTEGIPLGERYTMPESGVADYKLFFPRLSPGVTKFDYGEAGDGWHIFDIRLNSDPAPSMAPSEIAGHWFNENNGSWEISFLDDKAVYKKQLWKYDEIKVKNGEGSVSLKNEFRKIRLIIKAGKTGNILAGESANEMITLGKNPSKIFAGDQKSFQPPFLSTDSSVYSCLLRDYTPRAGRTGVIYLNNILSGNQNSFPFRISDDGFFSVKLPLLYPHEIFIRSNAYTGVVYMEPGKDLFRMIDNREKEVSDFLFMGDEGINAGLSACRNIRNFNYQELQDRILEMTPGMYKEFCSASRDKDKKALSEISQKQQLPGKVMQLLELQIDYSYYTRLMEYKMQYQSAYQTKYKVQDSQSKPPLNIEPPDSAYYSFLTEETMNNEAAILSNEYYYFINRLKYIDILRGSPIIITTFQIAEELEKSGYKFTAEEKELIDAVRKNKEIESRNLALRTKHRAQYADFFGKYKTAIMELPGRDMTEIEKHLTGKGISLTDDEKAMVEEFKSLESTDSFKKYMEFNSKYKEQLSEFSNRHNKFINMLFSRLNNEARNENLKTKLGVNKGLASDIMISQDQCRSIIQEVTPLGETELRKLVSGISAPFIRDYLESANNETITKIASNKDKKGFTVNATPVSEADKLFENLMKKYMGKVVYVDFWATWCGPCRSNIESIKPLKTELAGKDVVFVYITNQTSPKETWDNMIPDIKGEHYRLSADEWNYLSGKFNITGIPHIVLVDKKGNVANPHLAYVNNNTVKYQIEKLMKAN